MDMMKIKIRKLKYQLRLEDRLNNESKTKIEAMEKKMAEL